MKRGGAPFLRWLLNVGANAAAKCNDGSTALLQACRAADGASVQLLLYALRQQHNIQPHNAEAEKIETAEPIEGDSRCNRRSWLPTRLVHLGLASNGETPLHASIRYGATQSGGRSGNGGDRQGQWRRPGILGCVSLIADHITLSQLMQHKYKGQTCFELADTRVGSGAAAVSEFLCRVADALRLEEAATTGPPLEEKSNVSDGSGDSHFSSRWLVGALQRLQVAKFLRSCHRRANGDGGAHIHESQWGVGAMLWLATAPAGWEVTFRHDEQQIASAVVTSAATSTTTAVPLTIGDNGDGPSRGDASRGVWAGKGGGNGLRRSQTECFRPEDSEYEEFGE